MSHYGELPGIPAGTHFKNRADLSLAGVHRARQAGICGTQTRGGAESIVLNGGYEDDIDRGDEIIYTGHGSNDPTTGKQVGDQVLSPGNAALVESSLTGNPVRVIRGSGGDPRWSPDHGYRYDGLFRVDEYWWETGKSGYQVFRCRLTRIDDYENQRKQPELAPISQLRETPDRKEIRVQRIVRNTAVGETVKKLYDHRCQKCGIRLSIQGSPYAECAHIIPLGEPHNGPDTLDNVLCLCPNCHVTFDKGGWTIGEGAMILPDGKPLTTHRRHSISPDSVNYRFRMFGHHLRSDPNDITADE